MSNKWIIKDHMGSAMQFRIQSRDALWGIVEAIDSQNLSETDSEAITIGVTADVQPFKMQKFGVTSVEVPLQIRITPNISNRYRKKLEHINKCKILQTHVQNNLPVPTITC